MSRQATPIRLTDQQKQTLEHWGRSPRAEHRYVVRASIVIAAADGQSNVQIADSLGMSTSTVCKWRVRFAAAGSGGLRDAPRPGRPRLYDETTDQRILQLLDEPPPAGHSQWTGTLLAQVLGDVPADQVRRILRRLKIDLHQTKSWCASDDPEFASKAADIVGLYLNPPQNAVVVCMDEKPHIQALQRAQGWLRLPNGKAITGRSHEYKRHGTTNLFCALEVATGLVKTGHYKRRRRREFLDFMNELVAEYSDDTELHVVLDNLSTHKPKNDRWLARHLNVHFHYTPTHASWLNQVEIWFSKLSRAALKSASFTSPAQVRDAIDQFVKVHNENCQPLEWTKRDVRPKHHKPKYANL